MVNTGRKESITIVPLYVVLVLGVVSGVTGGLSLVSAD